MRLFQTLKELFTQSIILVEIHDYDTHIHLGVFPGTPQGRAEARACKEKNDLTHHGDESFRARFTVMPLGMDWQEVNRAHRRKKILNKLVRTTCAPGKRVQAFLSSSDRSENAIELRLNGVVTIVNLKSGKIVVNTDVGITLEGPADHFREIERPFFEFAEPKLDGNRCNIDISDSIQANNLGMRGEA